MDMLSKIGTFLVNKTGKFGLKCQAKSPEIMLVTGIVSIGVGVVWACVATTKVVKKVEDTTIEIEKIKTKVEDQANVPVETQKEMALVVVKGVGSVVKEYVIPALFLTAGVSCIIGSHGVMKRRNIALVAAYKAVETAFSDYRQRVVEELGEDKDRCFRHGIKQEKIQVLEVDEKGKVKKTEKIVERGDPAKVSMYARYFTKLDENGNDNEFYSDTDGYNQMFLTSQERFANDLLKSRGHLFLNEVYDMLGFKRMPYGQEVGWVLGNGDGYVDFHMHEVEIPEYRTERTFETVGEERVDFANGYRKSILLDLNVDGVVHTMI